MAVVVALLRRIDADAHFEAGDLAIVGGGGDRHAARLGIPEVAKIEPLATAQPEALGILAIRELAGQHTHADQVGAVDAFKALGNHRLDT